MPIDNVNKQNAACRTIILKPGQNRFVKKLAAGTPKQSHKNHDCPGKIGFNGQPV